MSDGAPIRYFGFKASISIQDSYSGNLGWVYTQKGMWDKRQGEKENQQ